MRGPDRPQLQWDPVDLVLEHGGYGAMLLRAYPHLQHGGSTQQSRTEVCFASSVTFVTGIGTRAGDETQT